MCHSELLYILVILESFWYNPYVILDVKNVYKVNDLGKTSYFRVTANKLTIYMFSMVFFVFILFQHVLNTCMTTSSYSEGRVGSYFNPATFYWRVCAELGEWAVMFRRCGMVCFVILLKLQNKSTCVVRLIDCHWKMLTIFFCILYSHFLPLSFLLSQFSCRIIDDISRL